MSNLTFTPELVARSYDVKKTGFVDALKVDAAALAAIDTNKDGKVSVAELSAGLGNDSIIISKDAVRLANGKLQAAKAGQFDQSVETANKAVYAASRSIDDLDASAKTQGKTDINWAVAQYNNGADIINQFNAVVSRSFTPPSRHERDVMDGLRNKMSGFKAILDRVRGINPEAQRDELAVQARAVYEAAASHLEGNPDNSGSELARVGVDVDRAGQAAVGLARRADADRAFIQNPTGT